MTKTAALLIAATLVTGARPYTDPVQYEFDRSHTNIGFVVKHMMVTNVRGQFTDYTGGIFVNEADITRSRVEVTIKAASVDTNNERRDTHLRSADFFEVERFPDIRFVSRRIEKTSSGLVAVGDLTIRDVTREVRIPFEITGPINAGNGRKRIGVEGAITVKRQDFGLNYSRMTEAVQVVGDDVRIELDVSAVTPAAR